MDRLSQKASAQWWPEKNIADFFHPVFKIGENDLGSSEEMKRTLDCLIFHHDFNQETVQDISGRDDRSIIVGEDFLTSSFVEATKVSYQDNPELGLSIDLLSDSYQECKLSYLESPYTSDETVNFSFDSKDFDKLIKTSTKALKDPFSLIPFVINVIDSSNVLKQSLTFYQQDNKQLPQNFIEIIKQPMFTDKTIADISYSMNDERDSKIVDTQTPIKPYLIDNEEAEKTYANFGELELD